MNRILIADDHEVVRRGLRQILADAFPTATLGEACNSVEALSLATQEAWDLVLLDLNMPGRGGLEVLEELHRSHPRLPILVLSAYPEEQFAIRALKLGAAGYLSKQSAADELVAAVRKTAAGGRYVTSSLAEHLARSLSQDHDLAPHESLSPRELQVLRLIAAGKTLKTIATELSLSEKTVSTYRARIGEKLSLHSNVDLVRYALEHRLHE
jgi:two-component system, NarL family, invasion response regulator UvrY